MAYAIADRVFETSTTTGTGSFNLAGSTTGFQTFVAGVGTGNTCNYEINNGTDWEIGIGTITAGSPDVLSRDTVYSSSNAGAKVNWGSGTKNVFLPLTANNTAITNKANAFSGNNTFSGSNNFSSGSMTLPAAIIALFATAAQGDLADTSLQPTEATKLTQSATVTSTSGVTVPFTGIPSGVNKIDISVSTLSTSGTSKIELAIGDSGGIEVTGYSGVISQLAAGSVATDQHPTDAFTAVRSPSASASLSGTVTLTLVDAATFTWAVSGGFGHNDSTSSYIVRGSKSLSSELTQLQLQTANATDTFDAGLVSIQYYKDA
jgi:hypothetical protein